ncbi:MAG: SPFH domain-containing protein, partial [Flavipsychrobacter sp.]
MEKVIRPMNGYLALVIALSLILLSIFLFSMTPGMPAIAIPGILSFAIAIFLLKGLMIVQPNHARVLNFFGKYVGSVKENGMFFVNPLYATQRISQRAQNQATPTLKVNDKMGNPIEIAAVLVWQVADTYKAAYEVADYVAYVRMQSEAALRNMAM